MSVGSGTSTGGGRDSFLDPAQVKLYHSSRGRLVMRIDGEDHEFAVMGFDINTRPPPPANAVPEPTAALLFGAGMLIAGRATTRRTR